MNTAIVLFIVAAAVGGLIWYRKEARRYKNPIKGSGGGKNQGWPWKRK